MENIGFIGLGNMGSSMAVNLSKNGHHVYGYDLDTKLTDNLSNHGIIKLNAIKDLPDAGAPNRREIVCSSNNLSIR